MGLYWWIKSTLRWTVILAQVTQITRITLFSYQILGSNFMSLETDSGFALKAFHEEKTTRSGILLALIFSQGSDLKLE